jgi:hypothetical protein
MAAMKLAAPVLLSFSLACAGSPSNADEATSKSEPAAKPEPAPAPEPVALAATPFEDEEGNYGYRSESGEIVIEAKYLMASEFTGDVASVVGDGGFWFIDRRGETLAKAFVVDNAADEFVEGRARIVEGDNPNARYGFIASDKTIAVAPSWSWLLPYSEGLAPVCKDCVHERMDEYWITKGGTWGYIDLEGKVVIEPRFSAAEPFANGRASVVENGRSFEIGPDGAELK